MTDYSLLTAEDRSHAETTGVHYENVPEQFTVDSSGLLVFSIRGLQFVKYACEMHELPFAPNLLETPKDLVRLALEMSRVRMGRLAASATRGLQSRTIPPVERDFARAMLEGNLQEVVEAAARHDDCVQAGPALVPFGGPRER